MRYDRKKDYDVPIICSIGMNKNIAKTLGEGVSLEIYWIRPRNMEPKRLYIARSSVRSVSQLELGPI